MSSVYVYIAVQPGSPESFVGTTASLLDMPWIVRFGVDRLVWFDSWSSQALADLRAKELSAMTQEERSALYRKHNPDVLDLYPRIQCSDPYE